MLLLNSGGLTRSPERLQGLQADEDCKAAAAVCDEMRLRGAVGAVGKFYCMH